MIDIVCGDPHFVQSLIDIETNKTHKICYDVFGETGQSIFILNDNKIGMKIEGILLNDYYIHSINIYFHKKRLFTIKIKSIEYKFKDYEWIQNGRLYLNEFLFNMNKNLLEISFLNEKSQLKIIIIKSKNNFGVWHLDVNFENLNKYENRNRFNGIIGDILNKKFSIFHKNQFIQEKNEIQIKFNDEIIFGKLKKRNNFQCIFLPFKQIILPKTIDFYVYNQNSNL